MNRSQFARYLSAIKMAVREVFMSSKRYTEEFKIEAVRQVTERGYSVAEVAGRLGMTTDYPDSKYFPIFRGSVSALILTRRTQ